MDLNVIYNIIESLAVNAVVAAIVIPLSIGLGMGLTYWGRKGIMKNVIDAMTDFVRKTSQVSQIIFVLYLVAPLVLRDGLSLIGLDGMEIYRSLGIWFTAVFALALNSACYQRVFLQSQINVIHADQKENARRLRIPEKLQFWKLWLPQAARASKENYFNEFAEVAKATTLLGYFGAPELLNYTSSMGLRTYDTTLWITIGVICVYMFVTAVLFLSKKGWNAVMGEEK